MVIRLSDKFPLQPPARLPEQLAAVIEEQIEKDHLKVGELLPPETRLAKQFGVSRSVVREALSRLKYDGLLASQQGKGVTVLGTRGRCSFRITGTGRADSKALAELFELRVVIESSAAAMAASRCTQKQLADLKSTLDRLAQAIATDTDGVLSDFDFHQGIAAASGNPHLRQFMQFLNENMMSAITAARHHSRLIPELTQAAQKEHEDLYRAISRKDPVAARQTAALHLINAAKRLGIAVADIPL